MDLIFVHNWICFAVYRTNHALEKHCISIWSCLCTGLVWSHVPIQGRFLGTEEDAGQRGPSPWMPRRVHTIVEEDYGLRASSKIVEEDLRIAGGASRSSPWILERARSCTEEDQGHRGSSLEQRDWRPGY
ncbi:hypothetical protein OUZ56_024769 [Daphnia magna]|uniref:Uncharacterized protein n=1 Tax=Daphnia magna TaxID=35525 RepID=A0ABQ9ZHZ3_9CRUS|nr:hypothetical protein OUZ56_024769 [Daphnia magna]